MFKPSNQQKAIFSAFAGKSGHILVRARAGTGKTSTSIEGLKYIPAGMKVLLCAFNKKIAEELSHRIAEVKPSAKVEAKTLHALGFGFIRDAWKGIRVDGKRGFRLAEKACGYGAKDSLVAAVAKLASFAKGSAPFATKEDMLEIVLDRDLFTQGMEEEGLSEEDLAEFGLRAMELARSKDGSIDFDDMVWIPVVNGWVKAIYDIVLVDECQDMNATQILLAQGACKKGGRMIVVGDDRQAIYGFRGADSGSLDRLKAELNAEEFPLTTTYRCAQKIVARAQEIVEDYQAMEGAEEGIVDECALSEIASKVKVGEAIISRKNAPLMPLCLNLLKNNVRAYIEGRDIGADLEKTVDILAKRRNSIPEFLSSVDKWEKKQIARIEKANYKNKERKIEEILDKAECLLVLAQDLASVAELKARIRSLFEDTGNGKRDRVVLSSIHKAKGLEFPRVFGLEYTLNKGRDQEELNLEYVLVTRAQSHYTAVF